MQKFFNTTGPCNTKQHYMVPALERVPDVMPMIERGHYFVIHAARQTGKTTFIQHLAQNLRLSAKYYALYCSLEAVHAFKDAERGLPQILSVIETSIMLSNLPEKEKYQRISQTDRLSSIIKLSLVQLAQILDKPLVLFFDEIDGLQDETLITFLRQLRDGYITRNEIPFVHSIVLVGMRDVRDYKSKIRDGRDTLGSKSPFNIIEKSLTIQNFSKANVVSLYQQHTQITGQVFENEAIDFIFEKSCGQPWLVNAIAKECIDELLKQDFSKNITVQLAAQAIKNIILRRDTHIDSLLDKLKEERIRKILEPILITTQTFEIDFSDDDFHYCKDLGLIKLEDRVLKPANPIYAEVIIRTLTYNSQVHIQPEYEYKWVTPDKKINMSGLLKDFQAFWRENSDIWQSKYQYKEAAPHLILQAFLQRVINGGGEILREYAYGRKRMDLCLKFNNQKYPIELKLNYGAKTRTDGLQQLSEYMDGLNEKEGWLVIFDKAPDKAWDEKIFWQTENYNHQIIHVVGC